MWFLRAWSPAPKSQNVKNDPSCCPKFDLFWDSPKYVEQIILKRSKESPERKFLGWWGTIKENEEKKKRDWSKLWLLSLRQQNRKLFLFMSATNSECGTKLIPLLLKSILISQKKFRGGRIKILPFSKATEIYSQENLKKN